MVKLRSIFEMVPNTWGIKFESREKAHDFYQESIKYYEETLGPITVNNDTWYIGTKLSDEEFKTKIIELLDKLNIPKDQYTISKTEIGKFWMPEV